MKHDTKMLAIIAALKDMGYEKEDLDEWLEDNEDGLIREFVGKRHEREFEKLALYHYNRLKP